MRLLKILTLIYSTVLTLALAASLGTILFYLRRISAGLGAIGSALTGVRDETEPLAGHVEPLPRVVATLADRAGDARGSLVRADEHLGRIAGAGLGGL